MLTAHCAIRTIHANRIGRPWLHRMRGGANHAALRAQKKRPIPTCEVLVGRIVRDAEAIIRNRLDAMVA